MNGKKILIDTNVIIYHLSGSEGLELLLSDKELYISAITYSELLCKQLPVKEQEILNDYLSSVQIIHTNNFICEVAAELKKQYRLKLPDALIAATCFFLNLPLFTFDNDFNKIEDLKILKLDES